MAIVKLNLSGHENAALAAEGYVFPGVIQVNLADAELPEKMAKFLSNYVGSGDTVYVALPGLSALSAIVLAALHGLTGSFPFVVPLVRNDEGQFVPGKPWDLQGFRNGVARPSRENVINL